MSKKEDYKRIIIFALAASLVLIQAALFAYVWYSFYRKLIFKPFWRKGNWILIGIYAMMYTLLSKSFGGLKVGYLKKLDILYSLLLATLCSNVVIYLQITLINRWFLHPWPIVAMTFTQIFWQIIWIYASGAIYSRIYQPRKLLVIYGDRSPGDIIKKLNSRRDKYKVSGIVNIKEGEEEVLRRMADYDGVIIWDLPAGIRNRYLKYCFVNSKRCYLSPKISDIILTGSDRIHLFDTPLLLSRNLGLTLDQRFFKRIFDIVASIAGLIVTAPLMGIIAFAVWAYDKGPVFYRQDRMTIGGRNFMIWKFRSMRVDSESDGARLAAKDDDRITPVGYWLRRLHLDELPQLINVLFGEMSMVGPRPERESISKEYEVEIPEFIYRLKVKAGLTGYAQVYGKYNTNPYDKLKLDLYYIENYSFLLDLKLVFMTIKIFFQKEVSEGVDKQQKNALKENRLRRRNERRERRERKKEEQQ